MGGDSIKYVWNYSSVERFQNALQLAPVTAKVSHFLSENGHSFCNLECAVHDLNNLIHEAASMSLKLKARNASKKRTPKHKKWFYFTLKEIKASLIVCSKKLAFKHFDKELRQRCFCLYRKYIKAKQAKRRIYLSIIMKPLESISSNIQKV